MDFPSPAVIPRNNPCHLEEPKAKPVSSQAARPPCHPEEQRDEGSPRICRHFPPYS